MNVLITGAAGMIGSLTVAAIANKGHSVFGVDRVDSHQTSENYTHLVADLSDAESFSKIVEEHHIDRVIHLAALAHTDNQTDLSYERYYHVNVECAENVFSASAKLGVPVLFISTADVYGFEKEKVSARTQPKPVTVYGKTKYMAEQKCCEICASSKYTIFRFAPVYTDTVVRDIQKRYYLKYPNIAYLVGKGTEYEVLYIETAIERMLQWLSVEPQNDIHNVKNPERMNTAKKIQEEKLNGRAKHVLKLPRWLLLFGFYITRLTGKNKYTYLLNKVVNPLRTE